MPTGAFISFGLPFQLFQASLFIRRPALSLMLQDKPCSDTCWEDFRSCKQICATSRRQAEAP